MPRVFLPPAIRPLAGGREFVDATGSSVGEAVRDVERQLPGFTERICEDGNLRPGLSVVVDGSASPLGMRTPVGPEAEIHFLPALGGG
jgi:molybdopterin converting factor small subunit